MLSIAGHPSAADTFRRAVEIIERVPSAAGDHTPRIAFAHERWWRGDYSTAQLLLDDEWRRAEQHGDEGELLRLTIFSGVLAMHSGRWDDAERQLDGALVEARAYWRTLALVYRGIVRGRRGDRRLLDDATAIRESPMGAADPILASTADFLIGLIDRAEGRLAEAAQRMTQLPTLSDASASRGADFAVLVPETVAVLVEAGRAAEADALTRQLERRRMQLEPWGDAAVDLCRGLLAHGAGDAAAALERTRTARARFAELGSPWELGQSLAAEGSVLRRMGQRRDAAEALERAVEIFEELGAEPARQRASDELRRVRPRPRRDDSLTTTERRVAALVATGSTNREVAANLFTTVATVEAHLTRIYSKLGIRSRTELARRVSDGSVVLESEDVGASRG